ncbi:hypothetical protein TVAG_311280 [Trichomonas vaginalis G3]|uniref:DUF3447 domain-containing protein n=1 Tax=Trichomonas vaginalis (strain ATCC PRA-98 / G3) TaxID=412133 RepID=A2FX54_TRIV3|nr:fatty-acyl-CoA binding [Trichomonas vaginalis G3]EAX90500.1 hypothetical protein TVAG_311280 [Trichomonas vaginalis G3]KAI5553555.1 fatty-acyl-CoA binding [Trichomonas vaginalis G3]|eukprot:XP_001303430.1 hypothetical protein [Trichomonas vaginalis G3]
MSEFPYDVLMDSLKEYNDILCRLYRLKTSRKGDIDAFFKEIDKQISKYLEYSSKYDFLVTITNAAKGNNGYIKSYLTLMGKILQKYHPNDLYETSFGQYILEKYFGIKSTESNQSKIGDLLKSLIYDDVKLLVSYTELSEFSHIDSINFTDFPCVKSHLTLLETCCYYGSVNCFKFLRTKFSAEITELCLQLSFLGGNPDIVSECLKYHEPNKKCMKYAIMSHNIDFVTFLMNEYKIPIDVDYCIKYDNIQAFLIHYDQTNDLKGFIVNTCYFPFVWKTIFIVYFKQLIKNTKNFFTLLNQLHFIAMSHLAKEISILKMIPGKLFFIMLQYIFMMISILIFCFIMEQLSSTNKTLKGRLLYIMQPLMAKRILQHIYMMGMQILI